MFLPVSAIPREETVMLTRHTRRILVLIICSACCLCGCSRRAQLEIRFQLPENKAVGQNEDVLFAFSACNLTGTSIDPWFYLSSAAGTRTGAIHFPVPLLPGANTSYLHTIQAGTILIEGENEFSVEAWTGPITDRSSRPITVSGARIAIWVTDRAGNGTEQSDGKR